MGRLLKFTIWLSELVIHFRTFKATWIPLEYQFSSDAIELPHSTVLAKFKPVDL
jgi:hypothetical protein